MRLILIACFLFDVALNAALAVRFAESDSSKAVWHLGLSALCAVLAAGRFCWEGGE